jgi:methylated-DNA-[protein]-cysteine S-methyltransferase
MNLRSRGIVEIPGWGSLLAVWEADKLLYLSLEPQTRPSPLPDSQDPFLAEVARQICAYFQGSLRCLDLPYTLPAKSTFCRRLWQEAQKIPYGQTISYGGLAARAGNPCAARAAGYAMSINQLFLIVPCHRVIATGGKLGGYGGRPDLKARLLTLEGLRVEEGRVL